MHVTGGMQRPIGSCTCAPRQAYTAQVSPDGGRLTQVVLDAGRYVIHIVDIARGTDDALDMPGSNNLPVWHPDGKRIAFLSMTSRRMAGTSSCNSRIRTGCIG